MFSFLFLLAPNVSADIFETNNAGSWAGGGSAGGELCYFNGTTFVRYSLSGLLGGTHGSLNIGSGTTEYVVTDHIAGGTFSFVYNLTSFTSGTTPPVEANNAVCQVDGGTTADFVRPSMACTVKNLEGTNTGTSPFTGPISGQYAIGCAYRQLPSDAKQS